MFIYKDLQNMYIYKQIVERHEKYQRDGYSKSCPEESNYTGWKMIISTEI